MFLLNVSHAYVKELENFYFNECTEMVRNYTLNGQLCIFGCSEMIISCYSPPQKLFSASEKNCVNTIIVSGSKPMQVSCKGKRLNQSMTWKAAKGTWNNLGDKRVTAVA